jgi:PTS system N-acetylgalactosamine-specific IIA component
MELVAGCNVGGILETVFQKDTISLGELADKMIEASKASTMRFKKIDVNALPTVNVSEEEGI